MNHEEVEKQEVLRQLRIYGRFGEPGILLTIGVMLRDS